MSKITMTTMSRRSILARAATGTAMVALPIAAIVSNEALAGAEPDAALLALGPIFAEWVALETKSSEDQRKFEEFVER